MRPKFFSTLSVLMLAAMLYASLGPQVCRAIMAGDGQGHKVTCCGEGGEPGQSEGAPADSSDSCPLHKLSLIELLPAPEDARVPQAPQAAVEALSLFTLNEFFAASFESIRPSDNTNSLQTFSRALYLVHLNLRR